MLSGSVLASITALSKIRPFESVESSSSFSWSGYRCCRGLVVVVVSCFMLLWLPTAKVESGFLNCFDAFKAKKDLCWSRLFWGISHKDIHQHVLVHKRGPHLILHLPIHRLMHSIC